MALTSGLILAEHYKIIESLGKGAMGEVYIAQDIRDNFEVALKLLHSETRCDREIVERFRREAMIVSVVESEHIAKVLDVAEDPEYGILIAFERLQGENLLERLQRTGRMEPVALAPMIEQILKALVAAHAKNIVHRDIKPSNIFLEDLEGDNYRVRLLDFGACKLPKTLVKTQLTEVGSSIGSGPYMPPEQFTDASSVGKAADIYAVGVLVYQCLTGKLPFRSPNDPIQLLIEKRSLPALTLTDAINKPWPVDLDLWVKTALQSDPNKRFPSAHAALLAWQAIDLSVLSTSNNHSVANPSNQSPVLTDTPVREETPNALLIMLVSFFAVVLLGGFLIALWLLTGK